MKNNCKVKVGVFVSGGGTNLGALIDAQKSGKLSSGEISLVVSNKSGVYALERAKNAGIKSVVFDKTEYKTQQDFESGVKKVLEENQIEVIVLAGFLKILSKEFINSYKNKIINVHPSLIPAFCGEGYYGLKVHQSALEKGVKVTGATVHFVNEIPDGGEIIFQKAVKVKNGDTPEVLQRRVMEEAEWKLLPKATEKVCKDILKRR